MAIVIRPKDFGLDLQPRPTAALRGQTSDRYVFDVHTGTSPAVRIQANLIRGAPTLGVYYIGGPSLVASSLAYACGHTGQDPWALLAEGEVDGGWTVIRASAPGGGYGSAFFGWEFYASGSTITVTVASPYPVASFVLSDPATVPWITATTRHVGPVAAGLTLYFPDLTALAEFCSVGVSTVLGWIGATGGVSWRVNTP